MKSISALLCEFAVILAASQSLVCADTVEVAPKPDATQTNAFYAGNRAPLLPSPLLKLPVGAIKPRGWLRKQLELEADGFVGRLEEISTFIKRKDNAWLNPEGKGHSGWEELPYWFRGFVTLGCVLDDQRIIEESRPFIENCFASQRPGGYFGTASNRGDEKRAPDLMPNMSMLFALQSWYEYTGDKRVLELMSRYFKWELTLPDNQFFAGGWQVPRNGDNLASVHWLYNRTGEPFLLELGEKLFRCGTRWTNLVKGGHNVDFSQGFRKPAHFYVQSREPAHLAATERNWESIMGIYGQVPGGMFGGDEFARVGYTDPRQAIETCGAVEMIQSEQFLLHITGDLKWADRCEDATFNTLPATMNADLKALRYLTSPNQVNSDKRSKAPELADGGPMQVMNPHDHRCCQHNAGLGWPRVAENLWHATPGNGLAAVFYGACEVRAKVGDGTEVRATEETRYPFDGDITFKLSTPKRVEFPLFLRVPGWCEKPELTINGKPVEVAAKPGHFLRLARAWADGDTVALKLPMRVALRTWAANKNSISVDHGPLTFSLKIGEKYQRSGGTDKWPAWEIVPTTPWNYALQVDAKNPAGSFEVIRKPWPESNMPFTHEGTPVELRANARKLPNWQEDHLGLVDKLQPSPVKSSQPLETVTLIPMGAARLRLAALPVLGDGPDAREWQLPPEPLMSYHRGAGTDPYEAMFDGKVPTSSYDKAVPRFTTYSFGGGEHGKKHWVQKNIDPEATVSSCEVYWFDESPVNASVRVPKSWRVLYRSGDQWKEVENASGYGLELDKFNVVTFTPVKTTGLRLEVQCQDKPRRYAMGIYEWRIR